MIRDVMHSSSAPRPRCPIAAESWHLTVDKSGSSFLPPRLNELLAARNGFFLSSDLVSALAVADAFSGAASTSSRIFPFPAPREPLFGTISGCPPTSTSPVAFAHRQVPLGVKQHDFQKPSHFGMQNFQWLTIALAIVRVHQSVFFHCCF